MHLFPGMKKKEAGASGGGKVDPHEAIRQLKKQEEQLEKRKGVMEHRMNEVSPS